MAPEKLNWNVGAQTKPFHTDYDWIKCTVTWTDLHYAGYWLRFYVPLNTKWDISKTFPKPISWLGMEKQNITQQKHTFTNQKKCTTTQNKHKDIARQSCAMVPRWRFLATFLRPVFAASCKQHISDLHSKFALGPHHVSKYGRHPTCGRWD